MRKIKYKLQYSIDLGVDFLLRNTNEQGIISGETDLYRHCLATLCLVENPRDKNEKVELALGRISQYSYINKNLLFINDNTISVSLSALAGACFCSSYNQKQWGLKYAKHISNLQKDDGYIKHEDGEHENLFAFCIYLFTKAYDIEKDRDWLDRAKLTSSWIIKYDADLSNCWNMLVINYLDQYVDKNEEETKYLNSMIAHCEDEVDLDIFANYGLIFCDNWIEKIENKLYERLNSQQSSANLFKGGAFMDVNGNIRIDWSYRNIHTFKRILDILR